VRLSTSHPLAGISGATNAITFVTQLLGDVTIVGPGAGRVETGYAVLSDLLEIHQHMTR
jgi:homoserine dehydrogenase